MLDGGQHRNADWRRGLRHESLDRLTLTGGTKERRATGLDDTLNRLPTEPSLSTSTRLAFAVVNAESVREIAEFTLNATEIGQR